MVQVRIYTPSKGVRREPPDIVSAFPFLIWTPLAGYNYEELGRMNELLRPHWVKVGARMTDSWLRPIMFCVDAHGLKLYCC